MWISVCGTTEGSKLWAVGSNEIWTNEPDQIGIQTWSQATTPPDFINAMPVQMRVNGDGKYQLITDARNGSYGAIYKSNNYGANWSQFSITNFPFPLLALTSKALGCCVSSSGKSQYVCIDGTSGGQHSENGAGGVYSSQDYGVTWSKILGVPNGQHDRISCDATGRYVVAIGSSVIYTSKNYGATWIIFSLGQGRSVYVSQTGDYIWIGLNNSSSNNLIFSTDHGQTFNYGNNPAGSNYINMIPDCIACNNDGSIVYTGSINGGYLNTFREYANEVRQLTAGAGITLTDIGSGGYTITGANVGVVELTPSYSNFGGYTTNAFNYTTTWDFQNYEYDITVDIQQGTGYFARLFWSWDNNTNNALYQQNWLDHDGGSFFQTGHNVSSPALIYMYGDNNIQHNFKARLRQALVPNIFHRRLIMEHSCVQTNIAPQQATYLTTFKNSRGYNQRIAVDNTGVDYPFNGTRTITFYISVSNYFAGGTGNEARLRIYRIPIK
jgi:hypothetical protein